MSHASEEKPHTRGSVTAATLRKSLQRLYVYTVILYVMLILFGLYVYFNGRNTTDALCSLRDDQVTRITQSIEFLKDHPDGVPKVASRADLIRSIAAQQRTILALQDLRCDNAATVPTVPGRTVPADNNP